MQTLRAKQGRRRELQAALAGLPLVSHAAQGSHYAHCLQYWARKNKSDPQVTSRKAVQRPGESALRAGVTAGPWPGGEQSACVLFFAS